MLFPQCLLLLREVLTHQLGHQRSHQVHLAEVGSDLNKYIHVFHHQFLQPGHRDIQQEKIRPRYILPSLLLLRYLAQGWALFPGLASSTFSSMI